MNSISDIEQWLEAAITDKVDKPTAEMLLEAGESVLEHWIVAKGQHPTEDKREGFRLLALHRQGAAGDPSFNACRETCRELVYHFNLAGSVVGNQPETDKCLSMMMLVANHLCLFVSGKMQEAALGEFCCSAKPIRSGERSNVSDNSSNNASKNASNNEIITLEKIDAHG